MVRALLEGRKTQTRRIIKDEIVQNGKWLGFENHHENVWEVYGDNPTNWDGDVKMNDWSEFVKCPYGQPGTKLWVREAFCSVDDTEYGGEEWVDYKATPRYAEPGVSHPGGWENSPDDLEALHWKPSIHMPRWASRITLEIVNVSVERVQDISEEDAMAEGFTGYECGCNRIMCESCMNTGWIEPPQLDFMFTWNDINAKRGYGWESNPFVWVVEFKKV